MWLYHYLLLPLVLALASACPCTVNDAGEVTCEPGTQDTLPFILPDCLSNSIENDQVQSLILMDQNFPQLKYGSFHHFPNLIHLDLSFCNIAGIDDFSLYTNSKLEHIILNRNAITRLPPLFNSISNSLLLLTVRHNKLESVNSLNLEILEILDLSYNMMTEQAVSETLTHLPNLHEINLDSNSISTVHKTTFAKQENINTLSLWKNKIEYIQPGTFDHMLQVQHIDLQSNPLTDYRTESWHLCHSLKKETLEIKLDDYMQVSQDLKVDDYTDSFCALFSNGGISVEASCSDEDGHLICLDISIEDIACELRTKEFKTISFVFPKDERMNKVENFFEAESNSYFQELNAIEGKPNITKYLADLKLYGTKFDLATLDEKVGPITETVTIFADTVYMSRPLENPIQCKLSIRARVVSISENIVMNMTNQQFFGHLISDQPVDSWANVQEVISGVGNSTFQLRKCGFISVQQEFQSNSLSTGSGVCSPRIFSVQEYETEHNTAPSVFFNRVQMNLLRMAVRTLASTKSNTPLALAMADHTLWKTKDPNIVADKNTYICAQKLIRDKQILSSHKRNVPFYSTNLMKELADVMYARMKDYATNETRLMDKLDIALGRMMDMNHIFEDAKQNRELYFRLNLETLEAIWNSTDTAWQWDFNATRESEKSIQESMERMANETYLMQTEEMEEMLARAQDTVVNDKAVVDNVKEQLERYFVEAKLSLESQRKRFRETNSAGRDVKREEEELKDDMEDWRDEQARKAAVGFFTAFLSVIGGFASAPPDPGAAISGIAAGIAQAEAAGEIIKQVMDGMVLIIEALAELDEMLDDIDIDIPDPEIAFDTAINWRGALENAFNMKDLVTDFNGVKNLGSTVVGSISDQTDGGVNPAHLQQAMFSFTDGGSELVKESVNFARLMMDLADITGDLKVAEQELSNAIKDVERIQELLNNLKQQHEDYITDMKKHREEYEKTCDDFAEAYAEASAETKERFKNESMTQFNEFKQAFEDSNQIYINQINQLTSALYTKVASLKQHSMVQRSMMMNLYEDYCDGLFYFSFTECDANMEDHPTMSENFGTLLEKLNDIAWDEITSLESLPNPFERFTNVFIDMVDQQATGFNSSGQLVGPVTSLRESREAYFNLNDYTTYFDPHYRVRLETIQIHLLDSDGKLFPSPPNEYMLFKVYFPLEFKNTDTQHNVHSFRAIGKVCSADYFIDDEGKPIQMTMCEIDQEFDGVNHKTSHDGVFRISSEEIDQNILNQVAGLKIIVSGSFITRGKRVGSKTILD